MKDERDVPTNFIHLLGHLALKVAALHHAIKLLPHDQRAMLESFQMFDERQLIDLDWV